MGETKFLRTLTSAEELKSLEEIIRATVALANRKIGAIIAIERETSLKDFVEIGTPLDARYRKKSFSAYSIPHRPFMMEPLSYGVTG